MLEAVRRELGRGSKRDALNGWTTAGLAALPTVQTQLGRMARQWLPAASRRAAPATAALAIGPAIALVLAGAGVMYLFDPVSGPRRREMIREKARLAWGDIQAMVRVRQDADGWSEDDRSHRMASGPARRESSFPDPVK